MRYQVIWEPEALAQAERFAKDDPDGLRQVFTAVDRLADDPRPEGAFGSPHLLRVHIGVYRVGTRSATGRSGSASSTSAACADRVTCRTVTEDDGRSPLLVRSRLPARHGAGRERQERDWTHLSPAEVFTNQQPAPRGSQASSSH